MFAVGFCGILERVFSSLDFPLLKFLHAECTLIRSKLAYFERLSTDELKTSLLPDKKDCLKVKPDGTVLDGHHRLIVLYRRNVDIHSLPREIVDDSSDLSSK